MYCVVCGKAVPPGGEHYANAWERSRKRFPCCSSACTTAFDPDEHWIPAVFPPIAVGDDAVRLRQLASQRLRSLDHPRPVVRELLLAGASAETLRALVAQSSAATDTSNRAAATKTLFGLLRGLLGGRATMSESRDTRSQRHYDDAQRDLAQWEAARTGHGRKPEG